MTDRGQTSYPSFFRLPRQILSTTGALVAKQGPLKSIVCLHVPL